MKVRKSNLVEDSLVSGFQPADYVDVYVCEIEDKGITADDIMEVFWTDMPRWVTALFKIRNFLVRFVGLKGGGKDMQILKDCIRQGTSYGMISVPAKSPEETVLCLDDKHLKAYISVLMKDVGENRKEVYFSTLVHFHRRLGYVYFYAIYPFHHLVVRSTIKSTLKKLLSQST